MNDLRIITPSSGDVTFGVYGKEADDGLMLLQRLYILLFSTHENSYRGTTNYTLLNFIEGGNTPDDSTLNAILTICCSDAVNCLSPEDRDKVGSFSATSINGNIQCNLVLADGTTVKGMINE